MSQEPNRDELANAIAKKENTRVQELLDQKLKVTPQHFTLAIKRRNSFAVEALIKHGCTGTSEDLSLAIENQDVSTINALIYQDKRCPVTLEHFKQARDKNNSALYTRIGDKLIQNGLMEEKQLEEKNLDELEVAINQGTEQMISNLFAAGFQAKDKHLTRAIDRHHAKIVLRLLTDFNTNCKATPEHLMQAIERDNYWIASHLTQSGKEVCQATSKHLSVALERESVKIIKLLCSHCKIEQSHLEQSNLPDMSLEIKQLVTEAYNKQKEQETSSASSSIPSNTAILVQVLTSTAIGFNKPVINEKSVQPPTSVVSTTPNVASTAKESAYRPTT